MSEWLVRETEPKKDSISFTISLKFGKYTGRRIRCKTKGANAKESSDAARKTLQSLAESLNKKGIKPRTKVEVFQAAHKVFKSANYQQTKLL